MRAAPDGGEADTRLAPAWTGERIVRSLVRFELLPPTGVNLDSPRAVRRFMTDHIIDVLGGRPCPNPSTR